MLYIHNVIDLMPFFILLMQQRVKWTARQKKNNYDKKINFLIVFLRKREREAVSEK